MVKKQWERQKRTLKWWMVCAIRWGRVLQWYVFTFHDYHANDDISCEQINSSRKEEFRDYRSFGEEREIHASSLPSKIFCHGRLY